MRDVDERSRENICTVIPSATRLRRPRKLVRKPTGSHAKPGPFLGCDTHQTVALDIVRRPKTTPVHELERYMRCNQCSEHQGRPYKRSHLVALRTNKISASDPASVWWPGER